MGILKCFIAATMFAAPAFGKGEMHQDFVKGGTQVKVTAVAPAESVQRDGYLECTGKGVVYAGNTEIGEGDFRVTAKLRLRKFNHTAATFYIGGSHFGFDGSGKQLFTSRGWFGDKPVNIEPANKWLKDNEWFDFEVRRESGTLTILLNGQKVLAQKVGNDVAGAFGFRPWRGTLDIKEFSASGALLAKVLRVPGSTVVFGNNMDGYPNHRIPSMVTTKQGTLLAICEGRGLQKGTHGDISGNHLVLKRSIDNGKSWGPLELIHKEPGNSLLGPCTVVTESGRVVLVYHRYLPGTTEGNASEGLVGPRVVEVFVMTSDDEGRTWSEPRNITSSAKKPTGWTGILTGPGIAIQKRRAPNKGRIVVPCAHGPSGKWQCFVTYSDDNGETWKLGGEVPDPLGNECQVVELTDGRLMINSRSYRKKACRALTFSDDGGRTWSSMRDEPALPEPVCQGSILRYSDPLDGEPSRILFSNPGTANGRVNGTIRISLDEGRTWPSSVVIAPGYYGYSCLTRMKDDRIGCLYETAGTSEISFSSVPLEWLEEKR